MRRSALRAVAVATLAAASGCSLLLVRPPADPPSPGAPPACTPRPLSPVFDTLGAVAAGLGTLVFYSLATPLGGTPGDGARAMGAAGFVVTSTLVGSAFYGSAQGAACREARSAPRACDGTPGAACGPLEATTGGRGDPPAGTWGAHPPTPGR